MDEIRIELIERKLTYQPGENVAGQVSWRTDKAPEKAFLSLLWYTQGRGSVDSCVVEQTQLRSPGQQDCREFSLQLPQAPWSFSGKLVSLVWAVELVLEPGRRVQRTELLVGPGAKEISLIEP